MKIIIELVLILLCIFSTYYTYKNKIYILSIAFSFAVGFCLFAFLFLLSEL